MKNYKNRIAAVFAATMMISTLSSNVSGAEKNDILKGDADGDGSVSATDITLLYRYMFGAEEPDEETLKRADLNGNGRIDIADLILEKNIIINNNVNSESNTSAVTTEPIVTTIDFNEEPHGTTTVSDVSDYPEVTTVYEANTTSSETTNIPESTEKQPDATTNLPETSNETKPVTTPVTTKVTKPVTTTVTTKVTKPVTTTVTTKATKPVTTTVTTKETKPVTTTVTTKETKPVTTTVTTSVTLSDNTPLHIKFYPDEPKVIANISDQELLAMELLNNWRVENGSPELMISHELCYCADLRLEELKENWSASNRPDGRDIDTLLRDNYASFATTNRYHHINKTHDSAEEFFESAVDYMEKNDRVKLALAQDRVRIGVGFDKSNGYWNFFISR